MTRPYKHPKTGTYWLRKVVPEPLRAIVGKREMKATLGTKDPEAAKVAARDVMDRFDAVLASARARLLGSEAALNLREIMAAVGVAYRAEEARWLDDPGDRQHWEDEADYYSEMFVREDPSDPGHAFYPDSHIKAAAQAILVAQGISADRKTLSRTAEVWARERHGLALAMLRRCDGDWTPLGQDRFPTAAAKAAEAVAAIPVQTLVAGWAKETDKQGKALYDRERTAAGFVRFLGFDDAARVTADDVVRWKEARLAEGRSPKTVANDINELSPVWKWAKQNRKLDYTANPFANLAPAKKASSVRARHPFTEEEATALLLAARKQTGLLRWLPWLLCFTAGRLGEVVQSVKEDFVKIKGMPGWLALHIHAEGRGRSLKTPQSHRYVPLHPALMAEGFADYLAALPTGSPIFPDIGLDKFGTRKGRAGNKHSAWVRRTVGITDTRKDPAHAWRHTFEDRAREAGVPQNATDALMGHLNATNEAEGYGRGFKFMPATTAPYVARMSNPAVPKESDEPA